MRENYPRARTATQTKSPTTFLGTPKTKSFRPEIFGYLFDTWAVRAVRPERKRTADVIVTSGNAYVLYANVLTSSSHEHSFLLPLLSRIRTTTRRTLLLHRACHLKVTGHRPNIPGQTSRCGHHHGLRIICSLRAARTAASTTSPYRMAGCIPSLIFFLAQFEQRLTHVFK